MQTAFAKPRRGEAAPAFTTRLPVEQSRRHAGLHAAAPDSRNFRPEFGSFPASGGNSAEALDATFLYGSSDEATELCDSGRYLGAGGPVRLRSFRLSPKATAARAPSAEARQGESAAGSHICLTLDNALQICRNRGSRPETGRLLHRRRQARLPHQIHIDRACDAAAVSDRPDDE